MDKMIRIKESTLTLMKRLKDYKGSSSYDEIIEKLVTQELRKTHIRTKEGYVPIGTVVSDNGIVLVIKDIIGDKVIFSDNSYTINGGRVTWNLEKIANSVEEYDGGRLYE